MRHVWLRSSDLHEERSSPNEGARVATSAPAAMLATLALACGGAQPAESAAPVAPATEPEESGEDMREALLAGASSVLVVTELEQAQRFPLVAPDEAARVTASDVTCAHGVAQHVVVTTFMTELWPQYPVAIDALVCGTNVHYPVRIDPEHAQRLQEIAVEANGEGNLDGAEFAWRRLVNAYPEQGALHFQLAMTLGAKATALANAGVQDLQRYRDEVQHELESALRRDPPPPNVAHYLLGLIYAETTDPRARSELQAFLAGETTPETRGEAERILAQLPETP